MKWMPLILPLATNFRPQNHHEKNMRHIQRPLRIVGGEDDELFDTAHFQETFAKAGHAVPVTLVENINHIGLKLDPRALRSVVKAANIE